MIIQISSGRGPIECELAVGKFLKELQKKYTGLEIMECIAGEERECFSTVSLYSREDLSYLEGSVLWICKSPYRPLHKRKNWYIDVSIIEENYGVADDDSIKIETFRSGGKGGQHVNKVETGVRVTHLATGYQIVSTTFRSQFRNKQMAIKRLYEVLENRTSEKYQLQKKAAWAEHAKIVRGNPVFVYKGMDFKER